MQKLLSVEKQAHQSLETIAYTLVEKLKGLVAEERKITAEILNLLSQVEKQKIFAILGYSSLFEFCHKELGYSEGATQRRLSAMRLIQEIPETQNKVIDGTLSLSVISQAQTFFRKRKLQNRPMPKAQKLDLLSQLEGKSARACEETLIEIEPGFVKADKERHVTPNALEIRITVDTAFMQNLNSLKKRLSHKLPYATTKDILAYALAETAKKFGKYSSAADSSIVLNENAQKSIRKEYSSKKTSRYISTQSKHAVWHKYGGKCSYVSPFTSRKCNSQMFLEIDHIYPYAKGGPSTLENLQLLCDTHNRLKGLK